MFQGKPGCYATGAARGTDKGAAHSTAMGAIQYEMDEGSFHTFSNLLLKIENFFGFVKGGPEFSE